VIPGDAQDGLFSEVDALHAENTRLITLLEFHGIGWRLSPQPVTVAV